MRVLVVAASTMAQAGLAALVESAAGLEVVASVPPTAATAVARQLDAEVCLLDLEGSSDPESAVGDLVERIGCPLVVVAEAHTFAAALRAGARGALTPAVPASSLGAALQAVQRGIGVVYPPDALLAEPAAEDSSPPASARRASVEALTPRETDVLRLLAEGMTNQQLAGALHISEHTAKFHVSAVLGKLGAQSRAEAVAVGYRLGLVTV